jgi:alpha-beta hydrolase superfamily lysophospholipase
MQHRELTAVAIGGIDLYTQAWLPGTAPRAVIVVSHGLAEHGGRYHEVFNEPERARVTADLFRWLER